MSGSEAQQAPSTESRVDSLLDRLIGAEPAPEDQPPEAEDHDDQADEGEDDQAEEQSPAEPAVEEVEVEFEGKALKIPAKLKAELDKAQDYTRKTQEVAEQRRIFEVQQRTQAEQQAFLQSVQQEAEQLQQIEAQLEQYKKVDLSQIDSETLSRMSMVAANLREERARLKETIDGKRGDFKKKVIGAWDEMAEKARAAVLTTIPEWDKAAKSVAEYAITQGFPFEVITGYDRQTRERVGPGVVDPVFAKTLYYAMKWHQLQTSKPTATAKVANAAPVIKPGAVDTRGSKQIEHMNFRKALKNTANPSKKAELIGERLSKRFGF